MRNKKGGLYMGITTAIIVFMIGMLVIPFVKDSVTDFRTNIQCSNTSISDGAKMTCLFGDTVVPYFIILILSLVIGVIVGGL